MILPIKLINHKDKGILKGTEPIIVIVKCDYCKVRISTFAKKLN
jgi:hypothetical protein